MENKEIILARIADLLSKRGFIVQNNGELKARLKCIGLSEYFDKYSEYLTPYWYNTWNGRKYENNNEEYNLFLGLDSIFSELYNEKKHEEIMLFLKELTKSFNIGYIENHLEEDFEELGKLYQLLGLEIDIEYNKVNIVSCMQSDMVRIVELFSVERWLEDKYPEVYEAYDSAITAYVSGHPGLCIEACRTTLVSIFSCYKGTDSFAKWLRGIFNVSGEDSIATIGDLDSAIKKELSKSDLAEFFEENKEGKLTKTKTIYMIYSMMSDYGTHRNEATKEIPTIEDALFMLRLTDSILFWVYSKRG